MKTTHSLLLPLGGALLSLLPVAGARANCPLYGPLLPNPTNLFSEPAIHNVAAALDEIFYQAIDNNTSTGSERFSYAIEVFTASEDKPIWARYWTAPNLATLNTTGVRRVDGDTVFRIGSVTKIYTVLAFLAAVGDGVWNDPVTKYLPELAELAKNNARKSPIYATDWESITVGSLAGQTSGIIRDCELFRQERLTYQPPRMLTS
jgi:CubicO group peptidase (beta-lactamase class C family)